MQATTLLKVAGMDHIVLHVTDLERSRRFYIDVLGMTVERETQYGPFLNCGVHQIVLFPTRSDAEVPMGLVTIPTSDKVKGGAEFNHLALRLQSGSYEEVKQALEDAGVQVHNRPGDPRCIYIADPDGHRLQLLMADEPR